MEKLKLENVQVDCSELSVEQINEMASRVNTWKHNKSVTRHLDEFYFAKFKSSDEWYIRCFDKTKTLVSFNEFLKLAK